MSESIEQKMLKFMDVQFEGISPEEAKKIWEKPMSESKDRICDHCNMSIAIRNPSGYCDHLYYPENCSTCTGTASQLGSPLIYNPIQKELSARETAAMHLKVSMSGTPWLDEMIEASRRDEFIKAIMISDGEYSVKCLLQSADALLAASNKRKEGE